MLTEAKHKIADRRAKVAELVAKGMRTVEIADKLGVHFTTVSKDISASKGHKPAPPLDHSAVAGNKARQRIADLHSKGFSPSEIASKLGETKSKVYYHLSVLKGGANGVSGKGTTVSVNGKAGTEVNHAEEVSIAYIYGRTQANLESLAQSAGLPSATVAQRISELLRRQAHR